MVQFFENDDYYTGPPISSDMISRAEESLGVRLPQAYVDVLTERNGGVPRRRCFPTSFPTSWAPDHFEVRALLGVGGDMGIDSSSGEGSRELIAEWGYPDVGIVVCDMPSGGHDAVMLDYTHCGPQGEPVVAYVDEDRLPKRIANSFEEFLQKLRSCDEFEIPE